YRCSVYRHVLMPYLMTSFLVIPRPPFSSLFPYTTLFRSSLSSLSVSDEDRDAAGERLDARKTLVRSEVTLEGSTKTAVAAYLTRDRKSTRLNSSHVKISYAVFCLKKKNNIHTQQ